jgi:hypothetical protein
MRSDAANLLNRLGQNKFKYQEFRDNFADMELWPLFEALIRDPRISSDDRLFDDAAPAEASRDVAPAAPEPARAGGLFGRYEEQRAVPPVSREGDDVRSLLRQLNDRVSSGEL